MHSDLGLEETFGPPQELGVAFCVLMLCKPDSVLTCPQRALIFLPLSGGPQSLVKPWFAKG